MFSRMSSVSFRSSLTPAAVLVGETATARLIDIVFGTRFFTMVSECCWILVLWNDPCDIGISVFYVGSSVSFKLLTLPGSGGLSTNTSSVFMKTGVSRTLLSKLSLYFFFVTVNRLSTNGLNVGGRWSSNIKAIVAKTELRNMWGDTLLGKSRKIADEESNAIAPAGCLSRNKLNAETRESMNLSILCVHQRLKKYVPFLLVIG